MPKKLSIDEISTYISSFGYKLVSDHYENKSSVISLICPNNHEYNTTYANFKRGKRCRVCMRGHSSRIKKSHNDILLFFKSYNYEVLNIEDYQNNQTVLHTICPDGHDYNTTYARFYQGHRCPVCKGSFKYEYEEVFEIFSNADFILLEKDYINNVTPMKYICKKHPHITQEISLNKLLCGRRCMDETDQFSVSLFFCTKLCKKRTAPVNVEVSGTVLLVSLPPL